MEELNYGKSIERLSETMSALMSPDEELKPLTFTINGETYETILGTDNDRILSKKNNQEYTTAAFLKHAAQDEANKLSIRIQCPEKILLLGQTSRMRIIRAVQAHYAHAQVTEVTKLFTPVFKYYLDKVENKSIIGSEYRAALWATGHDEDLAAAHFINFGLANQPKDPMPGASIHKLTVQEDGILIEIHYPMSFE